MMAATFPTPAPKKQESFNIWALIGFASEVGFIIAIPAFLFGFGGAYLDRAFGTSPLFVILGLALALAASFLALWHRIKDFRLL